MAGETTWMAGLLQARLLVASLGEAASPPWWRSQAANDTSRRLLERLYPRTFLVASLETARRAAAKEHDAHIGAADTYHLFRLPVMDETLLHEYALSLPGRESLQEVAALVTPQAKLETLGALAKGEHAELVRGPVACGTLSDVRDSRSIRRLCAVYVAGFTEQQSVYPYLMKANPQ